MLVGARQVVTCRGPARARRGREMAEVEVLRDAAVLIDGDRIAWVGPRRDVGAQHGAPLHEIEIDGVLFPGFIDCHTHGVFGAPRLDDHEARALGVDYKAIAAAGGGILQSVRDVRTRPEADLATLTRSRLTALLQRGATTIEVKSGYGLELEAELKQLRVIRRLAQELPATLIPTFLGAHEVPPEYRGGGGTRADYVRLVCEEMIPTVAREGLARCCDVFCEPGVFSTAESRQILAAAARQGLAIKLHADELEGSGGAELAAELGALSADHLAAISDAGIRALAGSATVAVLLPATMVFLGKRSQAPARRLVEAGAAVALATDFNPGTSPTVSLPLVMTLGVSQLGLRHAEVVTAVTINAAAALGLAADRGQIAPGCVADLVVAAVDDWREVAYWMGSDVVSAVWTAGSACPA